MEERKEKSTKWELNYSQKIIAYSLLFSFLFLLSLDQLIKSKKTANSTSKIKSRKSSRERSPDRLINSHISPFDEHLPSSLAKTPKIRDQKLVKDIIVPVSPQTVDEVPKGSSLESLQSHRHTVDSYGGVGGGSSGAYGSRSGRGRLISRATAKQKVYRPKVWSNHKTLSNAARIKVGLKETLKLKSLRVMTRIQSLRSRTVVDHVFYNPYGKQHEGNFQYRLPENASICYFAYYPNMSKAPSRFTRRNKQHSVPTPELPPSQVNSVYQYSVEKLLEGEKSTFGAPKVAVIVPKKKALSSYEAVVRGNVDPALVEWSGGNTFSTRIFPIAPHSYQRVVIAYEQTLPRVDGKVRFQFNLPSDKGINLDFLLAVPKSHQKKSLFHPQVKRQSSDNCHYYQWEGKTSANTPSHLAYQFATTRQEHTIGQDRPGGPHYLYSRLTPKFPTTTTHLGASRALFLLDTSLSQEINEFGISLRLLHKILAANKEIKEFNVLLFNIGTTWWNQRGWIPNTEVTRKELKKNLNKIHLEGATDLAALFDRLKQTPWLNQKGKVDIFFFSNGQDTWGEGHEQRILSKYKQDLTYQPRFLCYNFGLGTANNNLFQLLANFGGATYSCRGESQIDHAAQAHKKATLHIKKISTPGLTDLIVQGSTHTLYPNQSLILGGRFTKSKAVITLECTYMGTPVKYTYPVKTIGRSTPSLHSSVFNSLAPRAFGELAVKTMEGKNDPALAKAITTYARYFSVPGKTCSLLMLENQRQYRRFRISKEKPTSEQMRRVKIKKLIQQANPLRLNASEKSRFAHFWESFTKHPQLKKSNLQEVSRLLSLVDQEEFNLSRKPTKGKLFFLHQIDKRYLSQRKKNRDDYQLYLKQGRSLFQQNLTGDYVRCLSSLVELAPQNTTVLRMVGYMLLQKKMTGQALQLFQRVRDKRIFEPHSYRDMAKGYELSRRFGPAALYYEIALAGRWNNRYRSLHPIVQNEYLIMLKKAIAQMKDRESRLSQFFQRRLNSLSKKVRFQSADLVVTATWNTDNTDVDLWVTEPNGEKCYYQNKRTRSGGNLTNDVTQGYGPERYSIANAASGRYRITLDYYSSNRNRMSDMTFVEVIITKYAGRPHQKTKRLFVILTGKEKNKTVTSVNFNREIE